MKNQRQMVKDYSKLYFTKNAATVLFTECVLYAAYIAVTPVLEEFRWKISCSSVIKWKKFVKYIAHYQIKNEAHAL